MGPWLYYHLRHTCIIYNANTKELNELLYMAGFIIFYHIGKQVVI